MTEGTHLAGEAVAALADGELTPQARERAIAHLFDCQECRAAVGAERDVAALLATSPSPDPSAGLLARLREIPMTTDFGQPDVVLAMDGDTILLGCRPGPTSQPEPPSRPAESRARMLAGPRRAVIGAVAAFGLAALTATVQFTSAQAGSAQRNVAPDDTYFDGPPVNRASQTEQGAPSAPPRGTPRPALAGLTGELPFVWMNPPGMGTSFSPGPGPASH